MKKKTSSVLLAGVFAALLAFAPVSTASVLYVEGYVSNCHLISRQVSGYGKADNHVVAKAGTRTSTNHQQGFNNLTAQAKSGASSASWSADGKGNILKDYWGSCTM